VRLFDDASHPVVGASIWVIREQSFEFPPRREIDSVKLCDQLSEARGISDPTGEFQWPELTPARRLVVARKSGIHSGYAWCEDAGETAPVVAIEMQRGEGIRGIVHDSDGKTPASGAFVTTMPRVRPGFESDTFAVFSRYLLGAATRTKADGRFFLDSLSGDLAELFCTMPGRSQIYVEWIMPQGQELFLRFVESVSVNGSVSDETGAPIAGANIYVSTPGVLPLPTTEPVHTDEHGEFLAEAVPPGLVEVKVDKRGFGIFKQPFMVKDGETFFDITLKPEVEFSGTVVDSKGIPIEGASVRVVDAAQFVMCGQMDTLADGSWFMYWVPSDSPIDVFVTRDGFAPREMRGLRAPQKELRFELKPRSDIECCVVDADGKPITHFAFRGTLRGAGRAQEYSSRIDAAWYAVTSPDGHFGFGDALFGLLEVSVRAGGFRPKTISDIDVASGAKVGPIEFRLEPSASIQGTIVDSTNKPIAGASIEIAETTFDGRPALTHEPFGTPSGPDGRFLLDTVPDGPFTLVVRRGENRTIFADLRANDFPRTFVLEPAGEIIGTINGSWARPETCVRIRISFDRTWVGREVRPDPDGRFHISDLAPGDYQIELVDDWSEEERMRNGRVTAFATVRPGEATMIVLDSTGSGVIEGRVVTAGTNLTGSSFCIHALTMAASGPPVAESSVDSNGLFRFDHLHAGTYRIRVGSFERGTSLALEREVTVQDNATVGPIEIVLGTSGIHGRVLRDDGSPADARVALIGSASGNEVAVVRTDSDGTYRILSAPDGSWFVVASAASFSDAVTGPVQFPADSDAPALEQQLTKESRLLARVRDDLGHPIAGAVVAIDLNSRPVQLRRQSLSTDSTGQAEFARLAAGTLTASATRAGYVPADPISVGLAVDQRRTVDLVLARCGTLDVVVKDARGQALAGVEVTIARVEDPPRGDAARKARTNSRGSARFTGLRAGRYDITGDGTGETSADVKPGESSNAELVGQR
jgi:protocatechuate 3,4-dioxygenase beta subunit